MLKFQPGQVVHVIAKRHGKRAVLSACVLLVFTYGKCPFEYHLNGITQTFQQDQLFATFDNALAELKRRNR